MTRTSGGPPAQGGPRTDAALLAGVRSGRPGAFQELRDRHWPTAVAVALVHTPVRTDAEQLAGTAVDQLLTELEGEEPAEEVFFRSRVVATVGRAGTRGVGASRSVVDVYLGLPGARQAVLWYQDVEGIGMDRTAELLGVSPSGATGLHLQARADLRAAWRQRAEAGTVTAACLDLAADLGALVDGVLREPHVRAAREHLAGCSRCTADYLYLQDTDAGLRNWVLPVLAGVHPWGPEAETLVDRVRSAGQESLALAQAAPVADRAGSALAAVHWSRGGARVVRDA